MKKSNILAHRGLWFCEEEKNSSNALFKALDLGFGIETDVRDLCGELIISHDPPMGNDMLLKDLMGHYSVSNSSSILALNIKSDGLSAKLSAILRSHHINMKNYFVFDMSVPDMRSYFDAGLTVFSRVSEYENQRKFFKQQAGIWVDNFSGTFPQVKTAKTLLKDGYSVALVSPELHGRNHEGIWADLLSDNAFQSEKFYLCTDFPVDAYKFFEVN